MVGLNFSGHWGIETESKGSKSYKMVGARLWESGWELGLCRLLARVVAEQKGFSYSWGNILTAACQIGSTRKQSLGI